MVDFARTLLMGQFLQLLGQCTSALYSVQCLHPFVLPDLIHFLIFSHVNSSPIFLLGSLKLLTESLGEVGLIVGFGVVGDCVGKLVGPVLGSVDWLTVGLVDVLAVGLVDVLAVG